MNLTHSPAEILAKVLVDLGVATEATAGESWPVFIDSEPQTPDNCITIYDTGGSPDGREMVGGEVQSHPAVQVRIRSKNHPIGWTKAGIIRTYLATQVDQRSVSIDDSRYVVHCISGIGDVLSLGKDVPESKRNLFTVNALMAITMTSES